MGYVESLMAENEEIVIKTRQHWMVLAKSFVVNVIFLVAIGVAAAVATLSPLDGMGLFVTVLFVIPIFAFCRDYLEWWNEEFIVTNRRVIQAEGIFNKHVLDSSLEKVNDVMLDQSFLGRIFDYGNIEILTASTGGVNNLHHIISPVKFKTEMLNQKENMGLDERVGAHGQGGQPNIPALIAELDKLRQQNVLTEAEFQQKKAELLSKM